MKLTDEEKNKMFGEIYAKKKLFIIPPSIFIVWNVVMMCFEGFSPDMEYQNWRFYIVVILVYHLYFVFTEGVHEFCFKKLSKDIKELQPKMQEMIKGIKEIKGIEERLIIKMSTFNDKAN